MFCRHIEERILFKNLFPSLLTLSQALARMFLHTTNLNGCNMAKYEIVVGNIGSVYTGNNYHNAKQEYEGWVNISREQYGRAAGEDVTLFEDWEPIMEHIGHNSSCIFAGFED